MYTCSVTNHLHDCIILLKWLLWASPLFIEGSVPCHRSEQSCIFVLEVLILTFSTILIFDFGIVSTVWCFLAFHFIWSLFINMAIKFWFQYKFNSTSRILFFCFCTIYLKKNNCNDRSQICIFLLFLIKYVNWKLMLKIMIDWLVFNTNFSNISAIYHGVNKFY